MQLNKNEKDRRNESKEIKAYNRPTLAPLLDYQSKNLKNKIDIYKKKQGRES